MPGGRRIKSDPGEIGWSAAQAEWSCRPPHPPSRAIPRCGLGRSSWRPGPDGDPGHWRLLVEEFERLTSAAADDMPTVSERLKFLDTIPLAP